MYILNGLRLGLRKTVRNEEVSALQRCPQTEVPLYFKQSSVCGVHMVVSRKTPDVVHTLRACIERVCMAE